MDFRIKQTDDVSLIQDMDQVCFPGESLPEADEAVWWVVLDEDGREAAYAGGIVDTYSPGVHDLFMNRAGVLPEYRGQGLQRRLIHTRYRFACREGYRSCYTYTVPFNYRSSNNLIRCGFTLWRPAWAWAGDEALYWHRAANAPSRQLAGPELMPLPASPEFVPRIK